MKKLILTALLAVMLTGCIGQAVPQTKITGFLAGQQFTLSSPKDSELAGLEVSAEQGGVIKIKVQSLKARMNPEVITTTGDAQAKLIDTAVKAGAAAVGQAAGAAAK